MNGIRLATLSTAFFMLCLGAHPGAGAAKKLEKPKYKIELGMLKQDYKAAQAIAKSLNEGYAALVDKEYQLPPKEGHECSGVDWSQFDEGLDVSDMVANADAEEMTNETIHWIAAYAHYEDGHKEPIAVAGIVARKNDEHDPAKGSHVYIRYLVAKQKSGGGNALVSWILRAFGHLPPKFTHIAVDSARSAVAWYGGHQFNVVGEACHEDDHKSCGCKSMKHTR